MRGERIESTDLVFEEWFRSNQPAGISVLLDSEWPIVREEQIDVLASVLELRSGYETNVEFRADERFKPRS